ncbi:hypothetical protein [Nitrosopumilus adriaticus]|uniref:Uncharacterized protein n=1 Tax=Nitrosopumilus adriaticus TaxID=1580092 RepID=A0A0D5C4T7_9ARCH|nr:hypothetical protein [Nitrosopumilus adriaticus]AJW71746.1 membrane protein of unknown function [Nitrosopumilus adriaticus]
MSTINNQFYDFLKKSQPLAFLGSFSMLIAVFAEPNDGMEAVYQNAAMASFVFIFSFIFSLLSQFAIQSEEKEGIEPTFIPEFLRYGTYALLGIGILYLVLTILEFKENFPALDGIIVGWVSLFIGIVWLYSVKGFYLSIKKSTNFFGPIFKIVGVFAGISAACSLIIIGGSEIFSAMYGIEIPWIFVFAMMFSVAYFGLGYAVILLITSILRKTSEEKYSDFPGVYVKKQSKIGRIYSIGFTGIMLIFIISSIFSINSLNSVLEINLDEFVTITDSIIINQSSANP